MNWTYVLDKHKLLVHTLENFIMKIINCFFFLYLIGHCKRVAHALASTLQDEDYIGLPSLAWGLSFFYSIPFTIWFHSQISINRLWFNTKFKIKKNK